MNFKRTIISSLVCGALAMGASEAANASAYTSSVLDITNVKLTKGNDTVTVLDGDGDIVATRRDGSLGAAVTFSDFSYLNASNNGHLFAELNSVSVNDSQNATVTALPGSGDITLTNKWVGVDAVGDDNYAIIPPPASLNYSNSDSDLSGSMLLPGGAQAQARSDTSLASQGDGNAHTDIGLNSQVVFTVASTLASGFTLSFDFMAYAAAQLSSNETAASLASANTTWAATFQRINPDGTVWTGADPKTKIWSGYDANLTASAISGQTNISSNSNSLAFFTGSLVAGGLYKLDINQHTDTNAKSVPEPTSLILLGLGLVGLAWSTSRKSYGSLAA
jgi:hypothetical protein